MSWATVRDAIETVLDAASGIASGSGNVIDYRPHVTRPDDFKTVLVNSTDPLHLWCVTREGATRRQTGAGLREVPTHDVLLLGYHGVDDYGQATEATFQGVIDTLLTDLINDTTIFTRQPEDGPVAIRATPITATLLGGRLCHYAEIRFTVQDAATES